MADRRVCDVCAWLSMWILGVQLLLHGDCLVHGEAPVGPQNCTKNYRPDLLCTVQTTEACAALVRVPTNWPPSPVKFTVGTFMDEIELPRRGDGQMMTYVMPGLKFSWQPPPNSGAEQVTGFELSLTFVGGNHHGRRKCYTFNLTNQITDFTTTFEHTVFPAGLSSTVVAKLYSLPKPKPEYDEGNYKMETVKMPSLMPKNHMVTGLWVFGMNWENDTCSRQVSCSFTQPPSELNITEVDVHLLDLNDQRNYYKTQRVRLAQKHHAVFGDVDPGTYQIHLEIVDDNFGDQQHCLCRKATGLCDPCQVSTSRNFTIGTSHIECPATQAPKQTTSTETETPTVGGSLTGSVIKNDDDQWKNTVGAAIGVVGAGLLLVILFFILTKFDLKCWGRQKLYGVDQNKPSIDKPPDSINNNTTKGTGNTVLRERVIYLVYTDDHSYHQRAVKVFAKYLKKYCMCDVRYPTWCLQEIREKGTMSWILETIQEADYVIIINSEGAFNLHQTPKEDISTCLKFANESPYGNIFTPAIRTVISNFYKDEAYKKYIMMQFHYTEDKFQIPQISPGYRYVLMKHFRELICHIHEINPEKLDCSVNLPLQPGSHAQTEGGRDLEQAVSAAHTFTKTHPNWYKVMYGSEDDRCDSGLSSLPIDSFPDYLKEQIQRECIDNLQRYRQDSAEFPINTDFTFLPVPQHDDLDAQSITQSQVSFVPPADLYSVSTEVTQRGGLALPYEVPHQFGGHPLADVNGGLVEHCQGHHATHHLPSCPHDTGLHSDQINISQSQNQHPAPFNISGHSPVLVPPQDEDMDSQTNSLCGGWPVKVDRGHHRRQNVTGDTLIIDDNLSWDAMCV